MTTKTRTLVSIALVCLILPITASADVIVQLKIGGNDSGWDAILADDIHTGIFVDSVTSSTVTIEIVKDFYLPPENGVFPSHVIRFRQRLDDAATVPTIRISDEFIANNTGEEWLDYHWQILEEVAAFDAAATDASGFNIDPFTNKVWVPAAGWDAAHASGLNVDEGVVPVGGLYMPGSVSGWLEIDVDLSAPAEVEFTLEQIPTPEPGTMAMLAVGGVGALVRRRRR